MTAFHAGGDTISADDLILSDLMPETAEDLTHRNPKAEKDRIIKAISVPGHGEVLRKYWMCPKRH